MKPKHIAVFFFAMQWIVAVFSTGIGNPATCCKKIEDKSLKVKISEIVSYLYQDDKLCDFKAVRFLLVSNITICCDPELLWTKKTIEKLDRIRMTTPTKPHPQFPETGIVTTKSGSPLQSSPSATTPNKIMTTIPYKPAMTIHSKSSTKQPDTPSQRQTTMEIIPTKISTTTDDTPVRPNIKTTLGTTPRIISTTRKTTKQPTSNTWKTTKQPISNTWKTTKQPTSNTWKTTKQPLGNGKQPPQWTTTPKPTMTVMTTTTDAMRVTGDIETTFTTTKNKVRTTSPLITSTTWKPTTFVTHSASTKTLPGNIRTRATTRSLTTTQTWTSRKSTRLTPEPNTTSMTTKMSTKRGKIKIRCPTTKTKTKTNLPWTIKRLMKKKRKGLKRIQMNIECES